MEDGVDEGKIAWAGWGQETKASGCHTKEFGSHLLSIQDSSKEKDKDVFSRKDALAAERERLGERIVWARGRIVWVLVPF